MSAEPAPPVAGPVTAQELAELPDDGWRYELVDGELKQMAPPGFQHGGVAINAGALLREHVRERQLGRVVGAGTGFRLSRDPDTVRALDFAFVARNRLPPRDQQRGFLELAPDLVVEVVSPSDGAEAVSEKALAWLAAGVRLVWVVYRDQRLVAVYAPGGTVTLVRDDEVLTGRDVLPDLRLLVSELFD